VYGSDRCDESKGCVRNKCDMSCGSDGSERHDGSDERDASGRCVTVTSMMAAAGVWQ
jgi:hypothetical protein